MMNKRRTVLIAIGVLLILFTSFLWFPRLRYIMEGVLNPPNYEATLILRPSRGTGVTPEMLTRARKNFSRRLRNQDIPHEITTQLPNQLLVRLTLPPFLSREEDVRQAFSSHRLTLNVVHEDSDKLVAGRIPIPDGFELLEGAGNFEPFVIAKRPLLEDAIEDAFATVSGTESEPSVCMQLTEDAARELRDAVTRKGDLRLAVVLDGKVYIAPKVREVPSDGAMILSGKFTSREAIDLSIVLRAGGVPWPLDFENGHFLK